MAKHRGRSKGIHRPGDFSPYDFDGNDFDTSRLEIRLQGGETVSLLGTVDRAAAFWSGFFEDRGLLHGR